MKKVLVDLGTPAARKVKWQCWRIAGPMDRRRLEGPKTVTAQTAYFARVAGSVEFGGCDPMCVEVQVEFLERLKSNGKKEKR
jgi:hypothetical protein